MQKIIYLILALISSSAVANDKNAMFGDGNSYQVSFSSGISTRSHRLEILYSVMTQYSALGTFFFLPARTNLEVGGVMGQRDNKGNRMNCSLHSGSVPCDSYNQAMLGLSKDVSLLSAYNLYLGIGLGAYIKSKSYGDERVNSAFTFGEKAFLGYNWGAVSTEVFIRHFSNGSLTNKNLGHNFVGMALGLNF